MLRQKYMLAKVLTVADTIFSFGHFEDVSTFFKNVINQFKQMNYSEFETDNFNQYERELDNLIGTRVN